MNNSRVLELADVNLGKLNDIENLVNLGKRTGTVYKNDHQYESVYFNRRIFLILQFCVYYKVKVFIHVFLLKPFLKNSSVPTMLLEKDWNVQKLFVYLIA